MIGADDIDRVRARPFGRVGVSDEPHRLDGSRVVDDDVETAPRVSRSCDGGTDASVVGGVAGLDAAGNATCADFVGNAGRGAGVTHEQGGRNPAHGQSHRGGGADAARCAGDDRGAFTAAGSGVQER